MNIGIVSEYNPFHNGHKYQTELLRREFPDARIISIMSPNWVQRGEMSVFDKYTRGKAAVLGGVDVALTMPFVFSVLSAEGFCKAGVKIAQLLGLDGISFGVESDRPDRLFEIASLHLSPRFSEWVRAICKEFPTLSEISAAQRAVGELLGEEYAKEAGSPNNILALEYIKAVKRSGASLKLIPIKRRGEGYASLTPSPLASAMFIRDVIAKGESISEYVPKECLSEYKTAVSSGMFSDKFRFEAFVHTKLILTDTDRLVAAAGSREIGERIAKHRLSSSCLEDLISKCTSPRITRSRIKRSLINTVFSLTHNDFLHITPGYTQLLALNDKGREFLSACRRKLQIPIITKNADYKKLLTSDGITQFEIEMLADAVWAAHAKASLTPDYFMKKSPFTGGTL